MTKSILMRGVAKTFRFFKLRDIDLDLEPGQILGFVGPNGAGKSTTIRILIGALAADHGEVQVLGGTMPDNQVKLKSEIGFVSHDMRLFGHATLSWHMRFMASIYPRWDESYAQALVRRFGLNLEQRVTHLSHGENMKAVLMLALARRPRLLILDEPTSGLDPVARHEIVNELMEVMRDDERSILFSSHNTVDVERISDRIAFIDRGQMVAFSYRDDFLDRWKRVQLQVDAQDALEDVDNCVEIVRDGHFATITTNAFSAHWLGQFVQRNAAVREVQRMNLEEIFVANVLHHRRDTTP
ncbi:MAG: ABC transporter ATP-binding protein [Povalibacter sp.]